METQNDITTTPLDQLNKEMTENLIGSRSKLAGQLIDAMLPSEQLLAALYFIWDAAERGQLDIFLIGDTAKQVKADKDLEGDKITVGCRRNEWDSGQGRIAQTFIEHSLGTKAVEVDNEVVYISAGVPIHIRLYEDNPTLKSFDIVFYRYETFNLPNPYTEFVEKYE